MPVKFWPAAVVAVVLALALLAGPAVAQTREDVIAAIEMSFGEAGPVIEAFDAIQAAVAADDAEAVASWISYPFQVTVDGEEYVFEGPEEVIEHYGSMMTDEIRSAVVDQKFEDLFFNAQGAMFGDGHLRPNGISRHPT